MKVAIVHDWLTGLRGGERCLQAFLSIYPEADIFTLFHVSGTTSPAIDKRVSKTSFLQKLPGARHYYRILLPLYPFAVKQFQFFGYDLVISLSHAAAKNIRVSKPTRHICYCFTPMRYIWDQARQYFGKLTSLFWPVITWLRKWDRDGSQTPEFIAISRFVAARVRCFYKRRAEVIFPPVDTSWITPRTNGEKGKAFLYAGALVPYKNPELVVRAFNEIGEEVWIVGSGPEEAKLKRMANENVKFFGRVSDEKLAELYRSCRALILPGAEDFGLVPIECMAAGRPVIGLYAGALRETLIGLRPWDNLSKPAQAATGVFIKEEKNHPLESLISSIYYFIERENDFDPRACIEQAKQFSPERFFSSWDTYLNQQADLDRMYA